MRIRYKKWARPELEQCPFYIEHPEEYKGNWKGYFKNQQPFHLELGCGKGGFISQIAPIHKEINYLAIDLVDPMLGLAKRKTEESYLKLGEKPDNIALTRFDIERISLLLNKEDQVDRIYINFCNPWPKGKHRKKRLTHSKQLEKYKEFLKNGAEIHFKTDDDDLFRASIDYFRESDFSILDITYDLHEKQDPENIETEHEKMFSEQGIKIKRLIAKWEIK